MTGAVKFYARGKSLAKSMLLPPPKFLTSWGCYPKHLSENYSIELQQLDAFLPALNEKKWIPRGLGRSYGDSAIADAVLNTSRLKHFIAFDDQAGILHCQSGVSLAEIIKVFLPRGWFLFVTPGTKYVTVGGAIASDVHGKNHHHAGCFSEFVEALELLCPTGERIVCSRSQHADIFHATCGGMGLTGLILSAKIQLKKVSSSYIDQKTFRTKSLAQTIRVLLEHETASYSVAWLDCLAPQNQQGRSLVFLGEHLTASDVNMDLCSFDETIKSLPLQYVAPFLNAYSIRAFNELYYRKAEGAQCVSLNQYFYPLDRLNGWNRLYGHHGFTQYQFVIPLDQTAAMEKILTEIRYFGVSSFLSVLKIFGAENHNYLSFPKKGLTLALDFKITPKLWAFLDRLDKLVIDAGGRVYLTKDCRLNAENFRRMYPRYEDFLEVRKRCDPHKSIQSLQSKRLEI